MCMYVYTYTNTHVCVHVKGFWVSYHRSPRQSRRHFSLIRDAGTQTLHRSGFRPFGAESDSKNSYQGALRRLGQACSREAHQERGFS